MGETPFLMGQVAGYTSDDLNDIRLQQYLNARVTVYYAGNAYQDTGRITYMDSNWVELTKDNNQRLLMPHIAIRIISLLEPMKAQGDADTLLRPAIGPESVKGIASKDE